MTDPVPAQRYTAQLAGAIEQRWQDIWEEQDTFYAQNPAGPWADAAAASSEKIMIQDMFPYPSGAGLHVGHPLGFIATDVYARYQRMLGKNVLYTMGFDAFGLPAEQYAIATGAHPRTTTEENIATYTRQLRQLGLSYDRRRMFNTIDEDYYCWTQWIFLQIYNAWFDERAGKARPISTLEEAYKTGEIPTPQGLPWEELTAVEQSQALDSRRLAYKADAPVNWAPGLGTVVSNEEVTAEGRTERGNFPVFQRTLPQWMMRITAYAERLIADLDALDWPESIKLMQRNWIGKSLGAHVRFTVADQDKSEASLEVFTTRPDTLFGATFMVVAPEHPLLAAGLPQVWPAGTKESWKQNSDSPQEAVSAYRLAASRKSERERQVEDKAKTGVFSGLYARNPVNGSLLPIFVADYVLMGYGTGAIMAVPAEDERDWDFAKTYDLPIIRTVQPPADHDEDTAYTGDGPAINSANDTISLNGLGKEEAIRTIVAWLEVENLGTAATTYKLRDWLFSRQRYWGEPFPIVYDAEGIAHSLPESMLPITLPEVADYSPATYAEDDADSLPVSPLARAQDWVQVELDLGNGPQKYTRETNTMPNWAGSCWYELRYCDPDNHKVFVDPECEKYWMGPHTGLGKDRPGDLGGVDLYVGGAEHAVLHLLYARFWHKVLADLGHVSSGEPFRKLFNQGMIQAYAFRDGRGQPVPAAEVETHQDESGAERFTWQGQPVTREYGKMGKSLKNVVTPDEMCATYGADTFRIYEMSMGPLDASRPWETRAVVGAQRFLQRLWRNVVEETTGEVRVSAAGSPEPPVSLKLTRLLHQTIAGVRDDYENLRFNTAAAKLIVLNNALTAEKNPPRSVIEPLVIMTAPLAPHIAEELWERLGHSASLAREPFPQADPQFLREETVTCVVQVQGKVRARLEVTPDISEEDLETQALAHPTIAALTADKEIRRVIVRAPRVVNVVL